MYITLILWYISSPLFPRHQKILHEARERERKILLRCNFVVHLVASLFTVFHYQNEITSISYNNHCFTHPRHRCIRSCSVFFLQQNPLAKDVFDSSSSSFLHSRRNIRPNNSQTSKKLGYNTVHVIAWKARNDQSD